MFSLISQVLREDELKSKELPVFLGFSASGNVEAEIVYANFGTEKDFEQLKGMGVSVKNKIVIVRQGRVFRGNKVSNLVIMTTIIVLLLLMTIIVVVVIIIIIIIINSYSSRKRRI